MASSQEKTASLREPEGPVVITPLKLSHLPKAQKTYFTAFANDPTMNYIFQTPDIKQGKKQELMTRASNFVLLVLGITQNITLTVNGGEAFTVGALPSRKGKFDRLFRSILLLKQSILLRFMTKEQKKRLFEVRGQLMEAMQKLFGDKINDMLDVQLLATNPSFQGRGYGGALLDKLTAIADAENRTSWLVSSNYANNMFYNEHGFEVVHIVLAGKDNPTWHQPPVISSIMIREPKATKIVVDKKP